jgi:hypothetical protein
VLAQRGADFFFNHSPIAYFFEVGFFDGFQDNLARTFDQILRLVERDEATRAG